VFRWLRRSDFRVLVSTFRSAVFDRATDYLVSHTRKAAAKLAGLLDSEDEHIRLGAARSVLKESIQLRLATELTDDCKWLVEEIKRLREEKNGAAQWAPPAPCDPPGPDRGAEWAQLGVLLADATRPSLPAAEALTAAGLCRRILDEMEGVGMGL